MLEIYLVRHGQTLFNEKDMVQGVCDSPLTKLGQKQAQNVASHLRQVAFTQWFSSPSLRAVDTGEAINPTLQVKKRKSPLVERVFHYIFKICT